MARQIERGTRIGRRAGYLLLGLLVASFTAVCTFEIIGQVWFQDVSSNQSDCRRGLLGLTQALDRARHAVASVPPGAGESAALTAFRQALNPQWRARASIARACDSNPKTSKALKRIEQLRYAEEHAVRYEARNLSRHRSQVQEIFSELGLPLTSRQPKNFPLTTTP